MRSTFAVARWRVWTALLTAISFLVLVSTAATHHHATVDEDQDCQICSVVSHKIADVPLVVMPRPVVIFISYVPYFLATPPTARAFPLLLPPGRGPPT